MRLRRIALAVTLGLVILVSLRAEPAFAQTGIMAFRDDCTGLLYAIRGDGSGRVALPLPSKPEPTDSYRDPWVLDVTTSGPVTVVYYVGISRTVVIDGRNVLTLVDHGLFAVQLDDINGVLTPQAPTPLSLTAIAGVDPNSARRGSFSPLASGDRLALVANSATASVLMTARVERDSNFKIIGLSDLVAVGDLYSIGRPNPAFSTSNGFAGFIDFSPNGRSIVASAYYDLWLIHLGGGNTFLSADLLTPITDGVAQWNPSFSPDGSQIAFTGGAINKNSGGVSSQDLNIYSLTLSNGAVRPVTRNSNKGSAASSRNNAAWSADNEWIAFSAYTTSTPRNSACSGMVNSEIFLIKADGSTMAAPVTKTNGTSVEAWLKWGW